MVDDEGAGVRADAGVNVRGTFALLLGCLEANGEDIGDWQPCLHEPLAKIGRGVVADGAILCCAIAE